jgi:tetratricopeptide (TPR) repeat protein
MTDRDVLKRASEALRDATEPSAEEVARLRARVLSRGKVTPLQQSAGKKNLRWILPLAAAFIAASAFAATPGAVDGMLSAVERYLDIELFGRAHQAAHKPAARTNERSAKHDDLAQSPLASVTPEPDLVPLALPTPDSEPLAAASPSVVRTPRAPHPNPLPKGEGTRTVEAESEKPPATPELAPGPSRDLLLYNKAHALHFRERRYDEALFAWEEYLGLTPTPTFALEARYNRALCLLRLGHYEEARAALLPFAEGRYVNGYRRDEATRFIQALDKRR